MNLDRLAACLFIAAAWLDGYLSGRLAEQRHQLRQYRERG